MKSVAALALAAYGAFTSFAVFGERQAGSTANKLIRRPTANLLENVQFFSLLHCAARIFTTAPLFQSRAEFSLFPLYSTRGARIFMRAPVRRLTKSYRKIAPSNSLRESKQKPKSQIVKGTRITIARYQNHDSQVPESR